LDPDWHGSPPANIRLLGALKRTVNRALRMGGKLVIAALLPMNLYLWMQTPTLGLIVLRSILVLATGFLTLFLFLRWVNPPTTAFILQDQRRRHRKGLPACHDRIWVPLRSISPSMRLAAVVAEDMRFLEHTGLEWYGMVLAWRASRSGAPLRGYSTISQQLVKNLFLWPAQTYTRKLIEAAISIAMECLWPKERILEIYLNVVQFGEGLYGIAAASRRYFNTTPEKLDDDQAAWLAAILPDPVGVQVGQPQARVVRRVEEIRASMNAHAARNAPIFTTVI
jgi:monofunctional biosynthetic peptidoglycan transglycosylase